jgi:hypothetical protein
MTFLRRLLSLAFSTHSPAALPRSYPNGPHRMIADAFREWAAAHEFRIGENTGLRLSGRLAGRDVVIDPGLDRSHPGWVQVTIAVALPAMKPTLVTRVTRPRDFATARIRALFDDADIGPELRAISVAPHYVRLRLAPGASPRVVEQSVHAVGDTMRTIHAAPESEPRHPCSTTVPYPS